MDCDKKRIESLGLGECPICELGLPEMLARSMHEGRLEFSISTPQAGGKSEIIFTCVGTRPGKNGRPNISQVKSAAKEIGHEMNGHKIIVNKSTVPVGTGGFVRRTIETTKCGNGTSDVVSNPGFLREGQAIPDTLQPDRIIIGTSSDTSPSRLLELYRPLG